MSEAHVEHRGISLDPKVGTIKVFFIECSNSTLGVSLAIALSRTAKWCQRTT